MAAPPQRNHSKTTPAAAEMNETTSYITVAYLKPQDVLLGRGRRVFGWEGNVKFRSLVAARCEAYHHSNDSNFRDKLAEDIFLQIRSEGGRFLRQSSKPDDGSGTMWGLTKSWTEVKASEGKRKIKQALRDSGAKAQETRDMHANTRQQGTARGAGQAKEQWKLSTSQSQHRQLQQRHLLPEQNVAIQGNPQYPESPVQSLREIPPLNRKYSSPMHNILPNQICFRHDDIIQQPVESHQTTLLPFHFQNELFASADHGTFTLPSSRNLLSPTKSMRQTVNNAVAGAALPERQMQPYLLSGAMTLGVATHIPCPLPMHQIYQGGLSSIPLQETIRHPSDIDVTFEREEGTLIGNQWGIRTPHALDDLMNSTGDEWFGDEEGAE